MKRVATPSMPTQRPPHSAEAPAAASTGGRPRPRPAAEGALSLSTSQRAGHLARGRLVEAVVLLLLVVGEAGRAQRGRRVLVDVLLVDREDLGAGVALLQLEVAGGLELHRSCRRSRSSESRASTSKSVSSKMSFSPLPGGRGRRGRRAASSAGDGLGLAAGGLAALMFVAAQRGQLDRVGLAQAEARGHLEVDPRVARPRQVDPREAGVGRRHVRVARPGQRGRLELVARRPGR